MRNSITRTGSLLIIMVLLMGAPGLAQEKKLMDNPRVKEAFNLLDKWLDSEVGYKRYPGLSIAVVHDQDVIWTGRYGYANLQDQLPARPDTIYSICSISKLFTNIAIMQLRDAGKTAVGRSDMRVSLLVRHQEDRSQGAADHHPQHHAALLGASARVRRAL